jgi:post-segregation antitoxin (ccd killing protein)
MIVQVKNAQREAWINENGKVISNLNQLGEKHGLLSDVLKKF